MRRGIAACMSWRPLPGRRARRSPAGPTGATAPRGPARPISDAVDGFGTRFAILNCLYGAPMLYSEDMAAGFRRALNDWLKAEWLDRDPRLRASIVVPPHASELAAEEIGRAAEDRRFVQALLPVMGETRPPGGSTGRSTPRRSGRTRWSPSMPAPPTATRRRRSAGPPISPGTTPRRRLPSSPRSPA